MTKIKVDISNALGVNAEKEIKNSLKNYKSSYKSLVGKTGKGNDFLGWVNLPSSINKSLTEKILEVSERISKNSEIVVVIGIGGSYLGARAVIDALSNHFNNLDEGNKFPKIIYAGNNISEDYHAELLELLDKKDYSVIVISKSGTTTEPAIAFRLIKKHIEKKYGKEKSKKRIIAITDKAKGALKKLSVSEGYETFDIPDDVGGRYSVLTPVGLLPIAVAGIDIKKIISGAVEMEKHLCNNVDVENNPAALYAIARNVLYKKGKTTEILAAYQPSLQYIAEWWKQLYGESEGKENKGIFPASVSFTADLHSMGQYIQQGLRNIFETVISIDSPKKKLQIPNDKDNLDGLNFISGKRLNEVNKMAELGTMLAHVDGKVPNIKISIPVLDEKNLGALIYFFEFACGLSGYMLDVNPFDQPGVEAYKNNMFALLDKPGYEKQSKAIKTKLKK
ncbi:MAG TPA: glucose-6-phosphate isomerase [Bacteroidales bacterium]|nr:glucose-6-phosphate isomerase [Bacteroidales bacterium]HPS15707.1 glucose-6-phosphate isomerase [Bacteroidales bacterium]